LFGSPELGEKLVTESPNADPAKSSALPNPSAFVVSNTNHFCTQIRL
jgi:hypothetical protein